jgi:hypothetical protein
MQTKVYSIYDEKVRAFASPFFMPNDAVALRAFADNVNKEDSSIHEHPEDYTLFCLGNFDDQTGEISSEKKSLGNGVQFKSVKEENFKTLMHQLIEKLEKANATN